MAVVSTVGGMKAVLVPKWRLAPLPSKGRGAGRRMFPSFHSATYLLSLSAGATNGRRSIPLIALFVMESPIYWLDLDAIGPSYVLLLAFVTLGLLAALVAWLGVVNRVLRLVHVVSRAISLSGFHLWEMLFSWAAWPALLITVFALLGLGCGGDWFFSWMAVFCGAVMLLLGVATSLAYIRIDMERYEVARGYMALHNPLKGQQLATHLVEYGRQVGVPLLGVATLSTVLGFALLNQGLYETVGQAWYKVGDRMAVPGYADFLSYTLLNLFRVADLLGIAEAYNYVHVSYVRQAQWPAATLLALFRGFLTVVLLQQIFASLRRGKLLTETITDFWSPHPPIHERARGSLSQHGPGAVRPLLTSLRSIEVMTPEQRLYLPRVIADVGPGILPILAHHLRDPHENVRAVAAAALGRLHALEYVPPLIHLATDDNEWVRQCVVESLGLILGPEGQTTRQRRPLHQMVGSSRHWLRRRLHRPTAASPDTPLDRVFLAVGTLRSTLTDPATAVRRQAALALGQIGPAAAPAAEDLIAALHDADESVCCHAAEALARVNGPPRQTVTALIELLQAPGLPTRTAAARALGALKSEAADAIPALMPLLKEHDEALRQAVAEALGQMGELPEMAVQSLTNGLSSHDTLERARTAEVLGSIGPAAAEVTSALADALEDSNDRVRAKAAQALGRIGEAGAEAVPQLVRALRDQDNWVSALAAEALGEMGDAAADAIPCLILSLRHMTPQVRANAAEALGKMGDAARPALPALSRAAQDGENVVRCQAIAALGQIGALPLEIRASLVAALQDADPEVRGATVAAIGRQPDLAAETPLHSLRADPSDAVRVEVARALASRTASADNLDCLCSLLEDANVLVQAESALALGKLGAAAAPAGPWLLKATQTADVEVREAALRAIALIQPPEATEAFLAGLRSAQPQIRRLAAAGLIKMPDISAEMVPALVEALCDPEVLVRANAARVLAAMETLPPEAIEPLIACAADANPALRTNAALSLRQAPASAVAEVFAHLLADQNSRVRLIAAAYLLVSDAPGDAAEVMASVLAEPSVRLRQVGLEILRPLGRRGVPVLDALRARVAEDPTADAGLTAVVEDLEKALAETREEAAPPASVLSQAE